MMPGFWQIVIILLIVLILFGAGKLPQILGDLGTGLRSFKDGIKGEDEKKDLPPPDNKGE
jgi:sec-independent protein translocase protein TatA